MSYYLSDVADFTYGEHLVHALHATATMSPLNPRQFAGFGYPVDDAGQSRNDS